MHPQITKTTNIIALYVPNLKDGNGDFLFSFKILADLKVRLANHLDTKMLESELVLVVDTESLELLKRLEGSKEFNIPVLTSEQFSANVKQGNYKLLAFMIMLTCMAMLGGMVDDDFVAGTKKILEHYTQELCKSLNVPAQTPILLLPEYSTAPTALLLSLPDYPDITLTASGLGAKEAGIVLTEELMQDISQDKRIAYWKELAEFGNAVRRGDSIANYEINTQMFLEYSRDSCPRFLAIQQIYSAHSSKDQDIISIGGNAKTKMRALLDMTAKLLTNGYSKVIFIDFENKSLEIIFDTGANKKVYRLLHTKSVSHRQMIALFALSENLVGVTGDQSFSEAISKKALIVKEKGLLHKKALDESIPHFFYLHSKNKKLFDLLTLLVTKVRMTEADYDTLKELFQNQQVLNDYRTVCTYLHKTRNYTNTLILDLRYHLLKESKLAYSKSMLFQKRKEHIQNQINHHYKVG